MSKQGTRSFSTDDSYVYNYKNDSYKRIYLKDGVYVLPVWFESDNRNEVETDADFKGHA